MNQDNVKKGLDDLQSAINILYEELGFTNEILNLQININKMRHEYNITDESNLTESNKGFVQ